MSLTPFHRMLAVGLFATSVVPPAWASDRSVQVDLPAGTLGRAIIALSRQTGDNIGTTSPAIASLPVEQIRGRMTLREALSRLVAERSASVIRTDAHNWRIAPSSKVPSPKATQKTHQSPPVTEAPEEVVVVAAKRRLALADYPGTARMLPVSLWETLGAPSDTQSVEDRLPSIASTHFGAGRDKIFVRGIAESGFTGPEQSTTGQYLNDTRLNYNGPDPSLKLYDIARIEVLEGPQGALYGAGSLGGVLRVVTIRPQLGERSARVSGGIAATEGGAPSFDAAGVINLPLIGPDAALRLVGYSMRDGGYIDDPSHGRKDINSVETRGARLAVRYAPDDWTIDLELAGQTIAAADSQWADAGAPPLQRSSPAPLGYRSDYLLSNISLSRQWDGLSLVSSSSMTHQYVLERYDATGSEPQAMIAHQTNRVTLFANETRLSREGADGAGWVMGVSLLHNVTRLDRIAVNAQGGTTPHQVARNRIWEETLFGEAGIALAPRLLLTMGARLTNAGTWGEATAYVDRTTIPIFGGAVSGRGGQDRLRVVPTMALSGRPFQALLLYLRYQQGFRPGGFGISDAHAHEYGSDRIATVEAGLRWGAPDAAFEIDASLSYSRWDRIIAEVVTQAGDPITENIGDGRIAALATQAAWRPTRGVSLNAGLFLNRSKLLHPRFGSIALDTGALPNVARLGAQAGANYSLNLRGGASLSLSANARYFGGSGVGAGPVLDAAQGDYVDSRLMIALSKGRRTVTLGATNLQGEIGNRFALGTPYQIYRAQATPMRPRTIRLGIDWKL